MGKPCAAAVAAHRDSTLPRRATRRKPPTEYARTLVCAFRANRVSAGGILPYAVRSGLRKIPPNPAPRLPFSIACGYTCPRPGGCPACAFRPSPILHSLYHWLIVVVPVLAVCWRRGTSAGAYAALAAVGLLALAGLLVRGSMMDIRRLFRDSETRKRDALDNGMVEGHVSLADKAAFAAKAPEPNR